MKPVLFLLPAVLFAQPLAEWAVAPVLKALGYSREVRQEGCHSTSCVVLIAPAKPPEGADGSLAQSFDAAPYCGHAVRLRAWIKLEAADPSARARLWLEVNLPGKQKGFRDDMGDRPISSTGWKSYEIMGEVASNAESVSVGVLLSGRGRVWIDSVTFETLPGESASLRESFQKLYARIDSAYEQRDLDAVAALAEPTARIIMGSTSLPLTEALVKIMNQVESGTSFVSQSTVTSVTQSGKEAIVYVNNQSVMTTGAGRKAVLSTNRDTWVRSGNGWKLEVSTLISARPVVTPAPLASVETAVTELKQRAAPIADAKSLAAFGSAVGDARVVLLGEAVHGMQEFVDIKRRLLEYLVREKGFTVLALDASWPDSLAADRYIKTGAGDPKAGLDALHNWRWSTQEMLEAVEWMRRYNQAPGSRATLTFTAFGIQAAQGAAQKVVDYLQQYSPADRATAEAAFRPARELDRRRDQVYDDDAQLAADEASTVVQLLDAKRAALSGKSSPEAWRDARQAASVVYQACTIRVPGKGPAYREEMMAAHLEWLATVHPGEKMIVWSDNDRIRLSAAGAHTKSAGGWLRETYGKEMYVVGFAFARGHVRAVSVQDGTVKGLAVQNATASEGAGDGVLDAAGMPAYFLNLAAIPAGGPLGQWLAEPHLFHNAGAEWVTGDDPDANQESVVLPSLYDGLIFVREGHPTTPLEPKR